MNKKNLCVGLAVGLVMLGVGTATSFGTLAWVGNGTDRAGLSSGAGTSINLNYWNSNWDYGDDTVGLIKFDLTPVKAPAGQRTVVDNAQFRFMIYAYGNSFTDAFYATTNNWNSSTTWANKPAPGAELGQLAVDGSWPGGSTHFVYDSRITAWVQQKLDAGDLTASVYMHDVDGPAAPSHASQTFVIVPSNAYINMNYHFEPVPEPATMSLLAVGGLLGLRRKH